MESHRAAGCLEVLIAQAQMLFEPDPMTGAKPRDVSLVIDRNDVSAMKAAVVALKKLK